MRTTSSVPLGRTKALPAGTSMTLPPILQALPVAGWNTKALQSSLSFSGREINRIVAAQLGNNTTTRCGLYQVVIGILPTIALSTRSVPRHTLQNMLHRGIDLVLQAWWLQALSLIGCGPELCTITHLNLQGALRTWLPAST